jgi:hypothetical protein
MAVEHDRIVDLPWARVTVLDGPESAIELALGATIAQVVPGLRAEDGFRGFLALKRADGRRAVVLTFWESAAAGARGGVSGFGLRDNAAALGISITDVHLLELVAQEGGGSA